MQRERLMAGLGPVAAGGLIAFSMPPWGWWPLAFVGIAILDRLVADQPTRTRFIRGALTGAWWIFPATLWMWDLTIPGYLFAGVTYSLFYGVGMALVPPGRGRRLALPAALVLVAFVRWSWPFGGVPLATLAISQSASPLGPSARLFGSSLMLVALTAIIGVGLSALFDGRRGLRSAAIAVAVVVLALVVTPLAPFGDPVGTAEIAIVQGGGPQNTRAATSSAKAVFDRHVEATRLVEGPVDFVLWPENVISVNGPLEDTTLFPVIADLAGEVGAPIIAGLVEGFGSRGDPDAHFLNASEIITAEGEIVSRYDKVRRVPYGEYVPFRSIVESVAPPEFLPSRDARAGTGPAILESDIGTLGISISWEVFFDTRARDAIQNGGLVLLNPTNGSSYWLTIVQSQQIASSRLRAMETGRWVLQAAPTGFSAIVTPDGDVIDRSGVSEQKVIQGTIELRDGLTWAVRFGRWPAVLTALMALAGGHGIARRSDTAAPVPDAGVTP